jgi:hypothetical protein
LKPEDLGKFAAADVAAGLPKGNRGRGVFHPFTTDEYGLVTIPVEIPTIETFF